MLNKPHYHGLNWLERSIGQTKYYILVKLKYHVLIWTINYLYDFKPFEKAIMQFYPKTHCTLFDKVKTWLQMEHDPRSNR